MYPSKFAYGNGNGNGNSADSQTEGFYAICPRNSARSNCRADSKTEGSQHLSGQPALIKAFDLLANEPANRIGSKPEMPPPPYLYQRKVPKKNSTRPRSPVQTPVHHDDEIFEACPFRAAQRKYIVNEIYAADLCLPLHCQHDALSDGWFEQQGPST